MVSRSGIPLTGSFYVVGRSLFFSSGRFAYADFRQKLFALFYELSPSSTGLVENLIVVQLVTISPTFHGTGR